MSNKIKIITRSIRVHFTKFVYTPWACDGRRGSPLARGIMARVCIQYFIWSLFWEANSRTYVRVNHFNGRGARRRFNRILVRKGRVNGRAIFNTWCWGWSHILHGKQCLQLPTVACDISCHHDDRASLNVSRLVWLAYTFPYFFSFCTKKTRHTSLGK